MDKLSETEEFILKLKQEIKRDIKLFYNVIYIILIISFLIFSILNLENLVLSIFYFLYAGFLSYKVFKFNKKSSEQF